jgi:hypothetical protein
MTAVDAATKEMEALHVKQNEETKVSNVLQQLTVFACRFGPVVVMMTVNCFLHTYVFKVRYLPIYWFP